MSHARYMLAGVTLLLNCSNAASAATVGFDPTPVNVGVGAPFTVDIVARGVTELAGGTIDLEFDSALLTINSVAINPHFDFLPDDGGPAAGGKWPGISFDVFANSPASGDFPIATLSLTALGPGSSSLMILGTSAFFSATSQIAPSLSAATVNAVPLPAPLWLFGSALLALGRLKKKSRAATSATPSQHVPQRVSPGQRKDLKRPWILASAFVLAPCTAIAWTYEQGDMTVAAVGMYVASTGYATFSPGVNTTCGGQFLYFDISKPIGHAMLATLLTAKASQQKVFVGYTPGADGNCALERIHIQ